MEILWLTLTRTLLLALLPTSNSHSTGIESASNLHPTGNEPATKVHPTALPVEDDAGQWATMNDNDDRARGPPGGAMPKSRCKALPGVGRPSHPLFKEPPTQPQGVLAVGQRPLEGPVLHLHADGAL